MPNLLSSTGLQTATKSELVTKFTNAMKAIYGNDIILDQDSPDGQMMMIFIQATLDNLDLLREIYNSLDPDKAFGVTLDSRVAFNGIQRQPGTYSRTNITIVTSQALNLYGKDQSVEPVYTASDNAGNEWELLVSQNVPAGGTYVYAFQSKVDGAVLTTPNTITIPVTIVLGVTSVNNPTPQSVIGVNEETDMELRIRRQRSVSIASQGYMSSLIAALENVEGVTDVFVYENNTSSTDVDGVPGHSIWVIVSGNYDDALVADAIYKKRNAGCGMFGAKSYTIQQLDGSPFIANWDDVTPDDLFIKFTLTSLDSSTPVDYERIIAELPTLFVPKVYGTVNVNTLATVIQSIDENALVTNAGFCETLGGTYAPTLTPSAKNIRYAITDDKIIMLPILVKPSSSIVAVSSTTDFSAYGGYGAYTFSLQVNNSGATINATTGVYNAGSTPGVDTVRVTDSNGNYTDVLMTVV